MKAGIFSKTFERPTLTGVLDAVVDYGLEAVQFNMVCAGQAEMPDEIDPALSDTIRDEHLKRNLEMSAVSGTFNIIDPNLEERAAGFRRLDVLAGQCERLGTSVITFCTGTRNPTSMWRAHPDNNTPEAWRDMLDSVAQSVEIAEKHNVSLAFEPEVSNVVDSAQKARNLLDEIKSPHLKVTIDGANLFHKGELPKMMEILDHAFDILGDDIVLAHAKDLSKDGEAGHEAAGTGLLDYDHYIFLLRKIGFEGGIVLHSLSEAQAPQCVKFLKDKLAK
ncbi:MAG: sugar phosphate isomerase/epimerase family protein [Chloroflexota bacterium]